MNDKYAFLYLRVSTLAQVDKASIPIQKEMLINRALSDGYQADKIMILSEEGKSGKEMSNRPELQKLISYVKEGIVGKVYVFKLDRLGRNMKDIHNIIHMFNENDVSLVALKDNIDTTNKSIAMILITIFALVAEIELNNIKTRTLQARKKRRLAGFPPVGIPPYGWKKFKNEKKEIELEVNEEEMEAVKLMFKWYVEDDLRTMQIADKLNELGYKTRKGKQFTFSTVARIINNPVHIGKFDYNRKSEHDIIMVDGRHQGVIPEKTFEIAMEKMNRRGGIANSKIHTYLFTSKIKCPECGRLLHGRTEWRHQHGKPLRYYVCSEAFRTKNCSNRKKYACDPIDNVLLAKIRNYLGSDEFRDRLHAELTDVRNNMTSTSMSIETRELELTELDKRINELSKMFASNKLDGDIYKNAINESEKRREQIKQELVLLKDDKTGLGYKEFVLDEHKFDRFINGAKKILSKEKSYQKLKEVLDLIVVEVALKNIAVGDINVILKVEKNIQDQIGIEIAPDFIEYEIKVVL